MEQQHSLNAPDETANPLSVSTINSISTFHELEETEEMEVEQLMPCINFDNEFEVIGTLTGENHDDDQSMELEGILTKPAHKLSRMDLFALLNDREGVLFFDPQNNPNGEPKHPGFERVLFEPTGNRDSAVTTNFLSCTAVGCTSFLSFSKTGGGHLKRHRLTHTVSTQDASNSSWRPLTDGHATDGPVASSMIAINKEPIASTITIDTDHNFRAKKRKGQMDVLVLLKDTQVAWHKGGDDDHGQDVEFCEITVADIQTISIVKFFEPPNDKTLRFLHKYRQPLSASRIRFRSTGKDYWILWSFSTLDLLDLLDNSDTFRSAWIDSYRAASILCHCTLLNTPHLMIYGMMKENSAFIICRWLHHDIEPIGFIGLRLQCSSQQMNNSADCGGILWNGWRYLVLDCCNTSFVDELVKMCKVEFNAQVQKRQYVIKMFTRDDFHAFEIDNKTTGEILRFQKASEGSPFPESFKGKVSSKAINRVKVYVLFRCEKLEENIAHVEEFEQIDPDVFEEKTAKRLITFGSI